MRLYKLRSTRSCSDVKVASCSAGATDLVSLPAPRLYFNVCLKVPQYCPKCRLPDYSCYWEHCSDDGKSFLQVFKRPFIRRTVLNKRFAEQFAGVLRSRRLIKLAVCPFTLLVLAGAYYGRTWDWLRVTPACSRTEPDSMELKLFDYDGVDNHRAFIRYKGIPEPEG
uniref:Uncharacterized protein n=1 Tax=Arundo donax TaxID=35708 RepID=A0A0A9GIS1_ARUDO